MVKRRVVIGIDLGKTNIRAAVFSLDGLRLQQLATASQLTDITSLQTIIAGLAAVFKSVSCGYAPTEIVGLGVGTFGVVDSASGVVLRSGSLDFWRKVPLADLLRSALNYQGPIRVVNDVHAAASGVPVVHPEWSCLSGVLVQLGTSVGVGAFGARYASGLSASPTFGQMAKIIYRRDIPCSERLYFTDVLGGRRISERASTLLGRHVSTNDALVATDLADSSVAAIRADFRGALVELVAWISALLTPDIVTFGGSVSLSLTADDMRFVTKSLVTTPHVALLGHDPHGTAGAAVAVLNQTGMTLC